uniref:BZIP domain-containing protein n=1 Tax=Plectus sambesii TaxID=2011161 RepID=A0A914W6Q7_9BILA
MNQAADGFVQQDQHHLTSGHMGYAHPVDNHQPVIVGGPNSAGGVAHAADLAVNSAEGAFAYPSHYNVATPTDPGTPCNPQNLFNSYYYNGLQSPILDIAFWPPAWPFTEIPPTDPAPEGLYGTAVGVHNYGTHLGSRLNPITQPNGHQFAMPTSSPYQTRNYQVVRQSNASPKKGGRRPKEDEYDDNVNLNEDDRDKRDKRRQRNKEAAARCRQRRLDTMMQLQDEVDKLKNDNDRQEDAIRTLRQQKDQLEQLLRNHGCKIPDELLMPVVTTAADFVNPNAPRKRPLTQHALAAPMAKIPKQEPTLTQVAGDVDNLQRPTSLAFGGGGNIANTPISFGNWSASGVPISTPSNGLTPGGEFMAQLLTGQTGLTPVTNNGGLTSLGFPITSLATPMDSESVLKTL